MTLPLAGRRIGMLTASSSRLGAGVAEAVVAQAAMVRDLGGEAIVFALNDQHATEDSGRYGSSEVVLCPVIGPAQIGCSPTMPRRLIEGRLDLLHLHGIWMYPSRAGAIWARRTGKPYLISPHGMLDGWITSRGRWKKALARIGYERDSWRSAFAFHVLSQHEADDVLRESGRMQSVIVPNPGPAIGSAPTAGRAPQIVFISRIHPKKNVLALVEAWKRLDPQDGATLRIVGWGDDEHIAELRSAADSAPASLTFLGPVYGAAKQELLASARFVILPTHSEGLPFAMLEAWAEGTPTIMTPDCNLPEGFAAGAALECGHSPDDIAAILERALAMETPEWLAMASAAQHLAAGQFSREVVTERWAQAYGMALAGTFTR